MFHICIDFFMLTNTLNTNINQSSLKISRSNDTFAVNFDRRLVRNIQFESLEW